MAGSKPVIASSRVSRHILTASTLGWALTCAAAPAVAQSTGTGGAPAELPAISVEGQGEGYKVDRSASPKVTAPLLDTPRTITVIPQEVIQERAATSLQDVLRTTPGITLGSGEGGNPIGDRPLIRGFDSQGDTFVDGLRDIGSQMREIFNLEQVEVTKGPSSAYAGRGSTGGTLNLVTKKPRLENVHAGSLTLGTDLTRRGTVDINRKIGDGAAIRLNAMGHKADVAGRDEVEVSRWGVAPSLSVGLNGPTRATFGYYHLSTDDIPDYGHPYDPRTGRPVDVDRETFYGLTNRDFQRTGIDSGTVEIEHDLTDRLMLRNIARYSRSTNDYIVTNPDDTRGNVVNGRVWRSPKTRNSWNNSFINQTDLSGSFETGPLKHSFSTGVEFSREKTSSRGYVVASGSSTCTAASTGRAPFNCTSLLDPNPKDPWSGSITRAASSTVTTTITRSAYALDTIDLNDQWSVNLGLRFDDYLTKVAPSGLQNDAQFWNYQVGVVYKPLPNGAIYVSYATSSNPAGESSGEGAQGISLTNQDLEPEENRSIELGTKWDLLDRKLSVTGAIFRTEKTNARVTNPLGGTQLLVGEQRVDGFELGVTGNITDRWKVFAGYTFLDSEVVDGGPAHTNEGNEFPNTPRHSFNVWTTYQPIEKLTVGGGVYFMSRRFGDAANRWSVPSYWRVDAMAAYEVTENVSLQLNVFNLLDETYYEKPYTAHFATVAPGRAALLTTSVKF